jgi:hypothetical protein
MRRLSSLCLIMIAASAAAGAQTLEDQAQAAGARFDGSASRSGVSGLRDAVSGVAAPSTPAGRPLPKDDAAMLDDVAHRGFLFFWEQADPVTGQEPDRAAASGVKPAGANVSSVASTGFGLSALCAGVRNGWVPRDQALTRAKTTLNFLLKTAPQEHGFFYHFIDSRTGARAYSSEVSTIDTALLLGGVLTARQCFGDDAEVRSLATAIYERVDFPWMLKGTPPLLSMGWTPENGFIPAAWGSYSEHMILDLLAVGSPTHPIPASEWNDWSRQVVHYGPYTYVAGDTPLFIHQYSQAYVDFRGVQDGHGIDYFQNSVTATLAQRQFFSDLSKDIPTYSANVWGGTASDTEHGYKAWGGPPRTADDDGTVAPCAPGGSIMFTPEQSLDALVEMKKRWGDKVYGRYGFVDAFNPADGWTDTDVLGIDQGITVLSAENARDGEIWNWFMKNPEIGRAMTAVGFRSPAS